MSAPATRQRFLVGARMIEVWAELEEPVGSEALATQLGYLRDLVDSSFKDASAAVAKTVDDIQQQFNVPMSTTSQEV